MWSAKRPAQRILVLVEVHWRHAERLDAEIRQLVQKFDLGDPRQVSRGTGRQVPQLVQLHGRRETDLALCLGRRRTKRPKGRLWYLDGQGHSQSVPGFGARDGLRFPCSSLNVKMGGFSVEDPSKIGGTPSWGVSCRPASLGQ